MLSTAWRQDKVAQMGVVHRFEIAWRMWWGRDDNWRYDSTFFIMENQSTDIHQASQPPTGSLGTGVSQGHKVHGTITIDCPRTDATVMLTHGSGMSSPISALMIRA